MCVGGFLLSVGVFVVVSLCCCVLLLRWIGMVCVVWFDLICVVVCLR